MITSFISNTHKQFIVTYTKKSFFQVSVTEGLCFHWEKKDGIASPPPSFFCGIRVTQLTYNEQTRLLCLKCSQEVIPVLNQYFPPHPMSDKGHVLGHILFRTRRWHKSELFTCLPCHHVINGFFPIRKRSLKSSMLLHGIIIFFGRQYGEGKCSDYCRKDWVCLSAMEPLTQLCIFQNKQYCNFSTTSVSLLWA